MAGFALDTANVHLSLLLSIAASPLSVASHSQLSECGCNCGVDAAFTWQDVHSANVPRVTHSEVPFFKCGVAAL